MKMGGREAARAAVARAEPTIASSSGPVAPRMRTTYAAASVFTVVCY